MSSLDVNPTRIPDVVVFHPRRHEDARGHLSETWSRERFRAAGYDLDIVQENHTLTRRRGTIRGLHYQAPPHAQDKLIRCLRGRSWHVGVDLRRDSASYGQWVGAELTPAGSQLLIPRGFAHGFCTLEDESEVLYKLTAPYRPDSEGGLRYDDPDLAIDWRVPGYELSVADRDREWPWLRDLDSPFGR